MSTSISIGLDAPRFVELYVQNNQDIASVKLFRPRYFPPVQDVIEGDNSVRMLLERGLELRDKIGLSFWDSTLLLISTESIVADNILRMATRHNSQDLDHNIVARSKCNEENIRAL